MMETLSGRTENLSADKRALLEERLRRAEAEVSTPRTIQPRKDPGSLVPASFAQERLWFLDQMNPGNLAQRLAAAVDLSGEVDLASLEAAYNEVVRRHEILRTSFVRVDGSLMQSVHEPERVTIGLAEMGGATSVEPARLIQKLTAEEVGRPFDLERGPLARLTAIRISPQKHVLVLVMHHIIGD